ncbi:MAG: glutamine synthetase, partial [Bacteroidota bacterium]
EYEWFVYQESPQSAAKKDYHQLERITPGMFGYSGLRSSQNHTYFNDLFKQLGEFGVALEGLHTETGPGVLEAALMYQPALEAADRAILFKQGVKEISYRHGFLASFMAKPTKELPGCGGHLHQSLWQNGHNVFYDGNAPDGMSPLFRHYLAGQLALLPKLFPLFAPTVNSYKRYVAGSWAATHVSWGIDNRTVALRVISGEEKATRLETRVPGADANPYLAIAAALAAGLYGIEHALPLNSTAVVGSAYESSLTQRLPSHLQAATLALKNSEVVAGLLGKEFIDHFVRSREWEWQQYQLAVTDWERARYLELI